MTVPDVTVSSYYGATRLWFAYGFFLFQFVEPIDMCLILLHLDDITNLHDTCSITVLLKFSTRPYILVLFWGPVINALLSPVRVE